MDFLISRITIRNKDNTGPADDPEDFLADLEGTDYSNSFGATCQIGHSTNILLYSSPHLPTPGPLQLSLSGHDGGHLQSDCLWTSSLLLAEFIERGDLCLKGKMILEMGAGSGLPSIVAGLKGAGEIVATDYPAKTVLGNLETNVKKNIVMENSLTGELPPVKVLGHEWGVLPASLPLSSYHHSADIILLADTLRMPSQHALHLSISYFLRTEDTARCWLVAGFHSGRSPIRDFVDEDALKEHGLEVERMWERNINGVERQWDKWGEDDEVEERNQWMIVVVLKRCMGEVVDVPED